MKPWDIIACPYCHSLLSDAVSEYLYCQHCKLSFPIKDDMIHFYDPTSEHWQKCVKQMEALFRLEYRENWTPRHDTIGYPYIGLSKDSGVGQRINAALFNVSLDLIGEELYRGTGYVLDIGAYHGWASFQFAKYKRVVALDISDHPCYGLGSVPSDVEKGIQKVIADSCYLPFRENSFDIVFMCSTFHHIHDKVRALNESYRVLRKDGVLITIGDRPMEEHQIEGIKADGIRDYEGMPYTKAELLNWFEQSAFEQIDLLPIKCTDNMHALGYYSLVRSPGNNAVIHGVK